MPVWVIRTSLLSSVIAKMHSRKVLQKVLVPKAKNQGMKIEKKVGSKISAFGYEGLGYSCCKDELQSMLFEQSRCRMNFLSTFYALTIGFSCQTTSSYVVPHCDSCLIKIY